MKRILITVGLAGTLLGIGMHYGAPTALAGTYKPPYPCNAIPANMPPAEKAKLINYCNALAAGLQKAPKHVPSTGAGAVTTGVTTLAPATLPVSGGGAPSSPDPTPLSLVGLALAALGLLLHRRAART